jgi:D-alanine-D-alanine ligase
MLIGLTYDLKSEYVAAGMPAEDAAEFDSEATIDALETALNRLGHRVDRIGSLKPLLVKLARGTRWDLVFNIAEGVHGFAREAQVPTVLEAYGIPSTFSDPAVLTLCLHKGFTKAVLKSRHVATTDYAVADTQADIDAIRLPYPLFVKPVAEGTGKGVAANSIVRDAAALSQTCSALIARYKQPVLIEPFLSGREFTVGLIGRGNDAYAAGCMEIVLRETAEAQIYSYANKADYLERVDYALASDAMAQEAMQVAVAGWRALGCRDAGRADLRADENGRVQLMEVNPLAGLNPVDSDLPILWRMLGRTYDDLIETILTQTIGRLKR